MKKLYAIIFILVFANNLRSQEFDSFTDPRDGKTYKTINIAGQVWMAENLSYLTKFSWCYNNSKKNCNQYGRLYTWEAANIACPVGWHLPSKEEFETLLNNLGGDGNKAYNLLIQGGNSGFSVSFGGFRNGIKAFGGIGKFAEYWSSSPNGEQNACSMSINNIDLMAHISGNGRTSGYSVRCIKDN
jgi:uncharacterized protein (TIGR02145 family)